MPKQIILMNSRVEMIDLLEEKVRTEPFLLQTIIEEYVLNMNEEKFTELEYFVVNHFGDD
jgi:hypothetical protein